MAGQSVVRVLHLSDLHFSVNTGWDADIVLRGLVRKLEEVTGEGHGPDVTAITGDIAATGTAEEYEAAARWIKVELLPRLPECGPDRLLLVPGNHDVDRQLVAEAATFYQDGLLLQGDQDMIKRALFGPDAHLFLDRHRAFLAFCECFREGPVRVPWWQTVVDCGEKTIGFMGLCSSWMSHSDEDYGRLLVGLCQLYSVLNPIADADIKVALMHHPLGYVREFDAQDVEAILQQHCRLILRGHLHKQGSRVVTYNGNRTIEIAAGAAYDRSNRLNGFQLVEIDPAQRWLRVQYFQWVDGAWVTQTNLCPDAPGGVATYYLGGAGDAPTPVARSAADSRGARYRKLESLLNQLSEPAPGTGDPSWPLSSQS